MPADRRYTDRTLTVVSGRGTKGRKGIEPDWRRQDVARLAGFDKVPGSLNLRSERPLWLRRRRGHAWTGGRLYVGAKIGGIEVALNKRGGFAASPHVFYVYAPVRLRDSLALEDGDEVTIAIPEDVLVRRVWLNDGVYRLRMLLRSVRGPTARSQAGPTV